MSVKSKIKLVRLVFADEVESNGNVLTIVQSYICDASEEVDFCVISDESDGPCRISSEGLGIVDAVKEVYLKKWSLPPEIVEVSDVCLAEVMDHGIEHEKRDCYDPNYDANVDEFDVDKNKKISDIDEINIDDDVNDFDIDDNKHEQKYVNEFDINDIDEFDVEKFSKKILKEIKGYGFTRVQKQSTQKTLEKMNLLRRK